MLWVFRSLDFSKLPVFAAYCTCTVPWRMRESAVIIPVCWHCIQMNFYQLLGMVSATEVIAVGSFDADLPHAE